MAVSPEFLPKVAQFLSHTNKVFGILGSGNNTVLASATNVATAAAAVLAVGVPPAIHESDARVVERWANQALPRANVLGIFTDTDIVNAADYATVRTSIVAYDPTLPTNYEASLEDE